MMLLSHDPRENAKLMREQADEWTIREPLILRELADDYQALAKEQPDH